jgi:hypothetical protein
VVAGADQVGAAAAVLGEYGESVPVAGDGLMSFGAFEGLLGDVVCPGHGVSEPHRLPGGRLEEIGWADRLVQQCPVQSPAGAWPSRRPPRAVARKRAPGTSRVTHRSARETGGDISR